MSNKQNTNNKASVKPDRSPVSKKQSKGKKTRNNNSARRKDTLFMGKPSQAPVAYSSKLRSGAAVQRSLPNGGIRIRHTELIGPVFKPTSAAGFPDAVASLFQTHRLRINPGSKGTFNWLATISSNFEFFKFHSVDIIFETRSSTSQKGSIIMSPDYDAADGQVAVSEQALFSNRGTVDDSIWKHIRLRLDVKAMNRLYKAHPNMSDARFATSSQDEKTIDPAQVFILVDSDDAAATKYGKIFISYDVELTDPQNPTDPNNLGGVSYTSTTLLNNSTKPINSIPNLGTYKVDNNIFTPLTNLPTVVNTLPTAVVGQFARDFTGFSTMNIGGTGISANSNLYVGNDPTTAAGSAGDVLQTLLGAAVNGTGTNEIASRTVSALAGQYLKIGTPNATSLTNFILNMGGSQSVI